MPRCLSHFFLCFSEARDSIEVGVVDLVQSVSSEAVVPSGSIFPILRGVLALFMEKYAIMSGLKTLVTSWYVIFGLFLLVS